MMKLRHIFALLLLAGTLASCGEGTVRRDANGDLYESFLPPEEASVGEAFQVDEYNTILITAVEAAQNEKGETVLLLTYDWTNGESSAQTINDNVDLTASQGGAALKPDLSLVTDRDRLVTPASPGGTLSGIQQGFILVSESENIYLSWMGQTPIVFVEGRPRSAYPVQVLIRLPSK